jgi:trimeric autotransporter adhesin
LETQQALNTTAILNIAVNATNIGNNGANIADLQTLTASHTTDIAGNATDITALQTLTASHTTDIAGNTTNIATNTSNIATNTSAIATKQDIITDGSLTIARTSGLQTALDSKQPTITNGSLTIAQTSGLQTALDGKQATIADADLTIAKTNGLQTALDSKQPTITDASLTIARTNGLQTALDSKQPTIADGDLTIAKTNGLQTALDGKQPTIADADLTIAKTNGLQTALDGKQATIADGDLTIAKTNGLQTALDRKQATITSATDLTINTLTTSSYIENKSNYAHYRSTSNIAMTGSVHLVGFASNVLTSSLITKTSNSRYTINRAGYYRVSSSLFPQNISIADRVVARGLFLKNGVENTSWSSDSYCYIRFDEYGEYGTCALDGVISLAVDDYIEVEMTCKIGSEAFDGELTGLRIRTRSNLTFQYLGS